jgi:hypothetical protein
MKSKKIKALLVLVILLSGIVLGGYLLNASGRYRNTDTSMNRLLLAFFNNNNVVVESKSVNEISIKWRSEGKKKEIFRNGKRIGNIINNKGVQVFEVSRNGRLVCTMYQFKPAWWHTHDYIFNLESDSCQCEIKGPDNLFSVDQ